MSDRTCRNRNVVRGLNAPATRVVDSAKRSMTGAWYATTSFQAPMSPENDSAPGLKQSLLWKEDDHEINVHRLGRFPQSSM